MSEKKCNLCYIRQFTAIPRRGRTVYDMPAYDNGVTKPPMGWSSWNCFGIHIDEEKITKTAEALVKTGLADKGYKFVNLDDNWHSSLRDGDGNLQGDLVRFPNGIPAITKIVNDMGLKLGLYSSNGTHTCENLPACFGNEERDAYTIAKFGAEFFKYDFCNHHAYSAEAPLVSSIELMKLGSPEIKIELKAEDAILGGNAKVVKDENMPCGSYIKGLNKNGGIIVFDGVNAPESGDYALTITNKKRGWYEKFIVVETNADAPDLIVVPPCKKFNFAARVQTVVHLNEGNNVIKLYNPIQRRTDGYVFQYRYMGQMLKKATKRVSEETQTPEKPITYSICEWGMNRPYRWGATAGNQWRTTPDIRPNWQWMTMIYDHTVKLYKYAVKGGYNDPDMLEVGNGTLTYDQNKSHFTLWAMMNAPLILGNDLRKFIKEDGSVDTDNLVLKIVTNENIIALNQDEKGKACKRVKHGRVDVLAKPLSDGTAFCVFNRYGREKTVTVDLSKYASDEYIEFAKKDEYQAKDLWTNETFTTDGKITIKVPAYGVVVYKLQ